MTRSVFGWDLPPGVTSRMIDEAFGGDDGPCLCCGRGIDDCICPPCPKCGVHGDPRCYGGEGSSLEFSTEQLIGQAELRIAGLRQSLDDELQAVEWLKEKRQSQAVADRIDGFDRDDLGESPDY